MKETSCKILVIDTSSEACSLGLILGNTVWVKHEILPRQQTQFILPMIDALLSEAKVSLPELTAIAFGAGPGSFTGLRIALGVAQGLAFAHNLPVIPLSNLQALAQQAYELEGHDQVWVGTDARMGEVYWNSFAKDAQGIMQPQGEDTLSEPKNVLFHPFQSPVWGMGSAWGALSKQFPEAFQLRPEFCTHESFTCVKAMLILAQWAYGQGEALEPEASEPRYIRDKVAKKKPSKKWSKLK